MQAQPFKINVPQRELDDLKSRLANTRWADDFGNEQWTYGVERGWLQDMVAYWRDGFDWRAQEAAMNAWPQFRAEIDGIPIHFLHVRGKGPNPKPLILTHGWPWTFWDFKELIGPLTDPVAHGGRAEDAFDLVVPSLPGFGFSVPLRTPGVDGPRIAGLWVRLMREVLGYDRFAAAGGDWGAMITSHLGHAHAQHLMGVYMTLTTAPGLDLNTLKPSDYADDEQWMPRRDAEAFPSIVSHVTVHSRDPQTLAYGLVDSPVGTAAWLWERRRAWSDCNGDLLSVHDRDFLCSLASLYWFNGSIASSLRIYFEHFRGGWAAPKVHDRMPSVEAPAGYAVFPKDVSHVPRAVMARHANLQRWTVMPGGGHFGPSEKPQLVLRELREFFRELA